MADFHVIHLSNGQRLAGELGALAVQNQGLIYLKLLEDDKVNERGIYIPHSSIILIAEASHQEAFEIAEEVNPKELPANIDPPFRDDFSEVL